MLNFVGFSLFTLFFGFLAAAILHKILHKVFRFRSAWNTTFVACTLTALICEFTFAASAGVYDSTAPAFALKVIGTTAFISMIAGAIACRLIIRSESGRQLPSAGAALLAFALTAPPVFFGAVLYFLT